MTTLDVSEGFTPRQPGNYRAVVSAIVAIDNKFGPRLRWSFDLGEDNDQWAWSDQKVSPRTKAGRWLAAAGVTVVPGQQVNTDDALGATVMLVLDIDPKTNRQVVKDVLPANPPSASEFTSATAAVALREMLARIGGSVSDAEMNSIGREIFSGDWSEDDLAELREAWVARKGAIAERRV